VFPENLFVRLDLTYRAKGNNAFAAVAAGPHRSLQSSPLRLMNLFSLSGLHRRLSNWIGSWTKDFVVFAPLADKKKTLINLQWVVVLATSYLLLFKKQEVVQNPWAFFLIALLFATILVLHRLPDPLFNHRFFALTLVVVDTIVISVAIGLNRESPWDLLLIFYFGLFIVAIGEGLIQVVIGCAIISVLSVLLHSGMNPLQLDSDTLFRIPFLFGASLLYAYLAEGARVEKKAVEKAKETERLKLQLVSALAHDIKNPLWVIMGTTESLVSDPWLSKEQAEALQRIQDNAQRIVKLVTGFLDASRAETGKMDVTLQPLELNALVREVGQQLIGELHRKTISLSVDLDELLPQVMGDAAQIDRVLWNLVGNAIQFTPRGGTIALRSYVDNGRVCVSVRDSGIGIPKEDIPLLFTEFRRSKGTAKVEGTGLGLFIVKTIVESHGGTVGAESREGEGSTFTVRFPARL